MVSNDDSLCASTSMKILTVSEFSKSEIMRRLSMDDEKIRVIYNAVSSRFHASESSRRNAGEVTGEKYILAVSSIDPRKNFSMLLKAFSLIEDKKYQIIYSWRTGSYFILPPLRIM